VRLRGRVYRPNFVWRFSFGYSMIYSPLITHNVYVAYVSYRNTNDYDFRVSFNTSRRSDIKIDVWYVNNTLSKYSVLGMRVVIEFHETGDPIR
jgi:hypothetical protein